MMRVFRSTADGAKPVFLRHPLPFTTAALIVAGAALRLNPPTADAAHTLWNRFGGEAEFAKRFPAYGMIDMHFTKEHKHHWGWIRTTPNDLDRLMIYVLERLPVKHRDYIVHELSNVDANQQWGVWGAGTKAKPGNKDGWSDDNDDGSWIMNSVGFVGPNQRYTVAIMSNTQVVKDGFDVMVYTSDDPIIARQLAEIGCIAVMPLAGLIGSGMGICNPWNLRIILEEATVPVLVDAGVGTASDATIAMELGCEAVLMNTAIAHAQNPVMMAEAMKHAIVAGRLAYLAGRMPRKLYASASSPLDGLIR